MTLLRKLLVLLALGFSVAAFARNGDSSGSASVATAVANPELHERWMLEGEKRYRSNCGRCHQPPRKLSPQTMSMAVRHMRVRAMLTEDDMKYVLYYMTH